MIATFQNGKWYEAPVSKTLRKHTADQPIWDGLVRRSSDVWAIWIGESDDGKYRLRALHVLGTGADDTRGPFELETFDEKTYLNSADVSENGTIAVIREDTLVLFDAGNDAASWTVAHSVPFPRSDGIDIRWSPDGVLHKSHRLEPSGVELQRFDAETGALQSLTKHHPEKEFPRILTPTISFDPSGTPIVLWMDFWP